MNNFVLCFYIRHTDDYVGKVSIVSYIGHLYIYTCSHHVSSVNIFNLLKTTGPISTKFGMEVPWPMAFQVCLYEIAPLPRAVGQGIF